MRRGTASMLCLGLLTLLLASRPALSDGPPDAELGKLDGTWVPTAADTDGKPAPESALKDLQVVFEKGNRRLTFRKVEPNGATERIATILVLDPTKTPAQIDIRKGTGPKGIVQGLYKLDGDELVLVSGEGGGPRPTDLRPGAGRAYLKLKRSK